MGINNEAKKCFSTILAIFEREDWKGVSILEYGNQLVRDMPSRISGKEYFTSLGATHVSIDTNGMDGALDLDLSLPLPNVGGPFDLVTNFGTTEHVMDNQYHPFKNMHDNCKKGGILLSIVPTWTFVKKHGTYRYDKSFFEHLANENNYKVVAIQINEKKNGCLVTAMFRKMNDKEFITEKEFNALPGIVCIDKTKYSDWGAYENFREDLLKKTGLPKGLIC